MSTRYEHFDLLSKMVQGAYLCSYIISVLFVLMAWPFSLITCFLFLFLKLVLPVLCPPQNFLLSICIFFTGLAKFVYLSSHFRPYLILSLVFSSPRCPPNGSSCANDIMFGHDCLNSSFFR